MEVKFGQGKRRFGLVRVKAKLAATAETSIALTFLAMNLEQRLRALACFFFATLDLSPKALGQIYFATS